MLVANFAVVKGDFHDLCNVKERSVVPTFCLVWALWLNATDDAVVTSIFESNATVYKSWDDDFVVVHSWNAKAQTSKFASSVEELIWSVLVNTN